MIWRALYHSILFLLLFVFSIPTLQAQSHNLLFTRDLACPDGCSYLVISSPKTTSEELLVVWADTVVFITAGDTLRLTPGDYQFRIAQTGYLDMINVKVELRENSFNELEIYPGQLRSVSLHRSSYHYYSWGATHYIESDPESDIYINDQKISTGSVMINLGAASARLTVLHPDGHFRSARIRKTEHRLESIYLYNRPKSTELLWLSLLPGSAQMRKNEPLKGWGLRAGIAIFAGTGALSYYNYQDARRSFVQYRNLYQSSLNESDALKYAELARKWESRTNSIHRYTMASIIGALVLYGANILDGIRPLSIGTWNGEVRMNPYISGPDSAGGTIVISL